jgi:SAM-dependent methyltransferase
MPEVLTKSERQREHFDAVHDRYERHYYDPTSMRYRQRYLYDVLLRDIDLNHCDVADLACGSGHTSQMLQNRYPNIRLCGFDISTRACKDYRKNVGAEAHQYDLTRGEDLGRRFDFALIIGGLHHCVTDLPGTLATIDRMLKPGGRFAMYEPNSRYFLQTVRTLWYRLDRNFDSETEEALDHDELLKLMGPRFDVEVLRYFGGPSFYLIFNSMILRVPVAWKPWLAPPLEVMEDIYNCLPGRLPYPGFVARWRKESDASDQVIGAGGG